MEIIQGGIDLILHMDQHLVTMIQFFGPWIYVILFLIIFAETGLVVTPFLPGDSLLFALGALTTLENSHLDLATLLILLSIAAVSGDALNYSIGHFIGPKVFTRESSWFFNKEHLIRTQNFYEKHGAMTIVLARFAPIIRTFAPFVAGIGKMKYSKFAIYNIAGGLAWIITFLCAGHFFGNVPAVKRNFHLVIFGIIFVSVLPILVGWAKGLREKSSMTI